MKAYGCKIMSIVEVLLRIQASNEKVLVFSQNASMLKMVKDASEGYGLKCFTLKELREFRSCFGFGALFLITNKNAAGLNLIEAVHTVLCEPILEPEVERQALGRNYRGGQTEVTTVHRFVAKGSIEPRALALSKLMQQSYVGGNTTPCCVSDIIKVFHTGHEFKVTPSETADRDVDAASAMDSMEAEELLSALDIDAAKEFEAPAAEQTLDPKMLDTAVDTVSIFII